MDNLVSIFHYCSSFTDYHTFYFLFLSLFTSPLPFPLRAALTSYKKWESRGTQKWLFARAISFGPISCRSLREKSLKVASMILRRMTCVLIGA